MTEFPPKENSEISPEDNLRLNVLLAQKPEAVRIDESSLVDYAGR